MLNFNSGGYGTASTPDFFLKKMSDSAIFDDNSFNFTLNDFYQCSF